MRSVRQLVLAVVAAFTLVLGLTAGPGAHPTRAPQVGTLVSARATDIRLDLGPLGKRAALRSCATKQFVGGKPGRLRVRYGMEQRTQNGRQGSFVLRNHAGQFMFCDMFGRDRPSILPMPTSSPSRPAVHVTGSHRAWDCTADVLTRVRANTWLKVQDPVRSARTRYWVGNEARPWFVSQRQGRFLHLQSWLQSPAPDARLRIQTQVLDDAGRVMDIRGIPSKPRPLGRTCGQIA